MLFTRGTQPNPLALTNETDPFCYDIALLRFAAQVFGLFTFRSYTVTLLYEICLLSNFEKAFHTGYIV